MALTVSQTARLANVSVRTLHHYDEIGLLRPSGRSDAGYRLYSDEDLDTLQQILFYRELGFGLGAIADAMNSEGFDRAEALRDQRTLLLQKHAQLSKMIRTIEAALDAEEGGAEMSRDEKFEVFGDFDPAEHETEAKERWGDTDAYRESARRTAGYRKKDWERFKAESEDINDAIARLMDEGVPANDVQAMDAVERHRLQIDEWFYPCSREMHAELGKMYVADPRFTETYERIRPGMAQYVCDAAAANVERAE